jgi:hypothetical protein
VQGLAIVLVWYHLQIMFFHKMFVLLGLRFKSKHFSCVMPSLFTKVLMLFICLHMFIELLVGYICEILGVGVYWDSYYGVD